MPSRPYDLLILDCDGVLVDSEGMSAAVLIAALAEIGVRVDAAHVARHFLGRSFPTVAAALRAQGAALPEDFEALYRARLLAAFEGALRPTPGLLPFLEALALPACVATSSSPQRLARSLEIAGLAGRLPRRFTASEVARGKPAPDLFLHAATGMGADPTRCLVVEDSAPGLEAAAAAGMASAFYGGGSHHASGSPLAGSLGAFASWAALAAAVPALTARAA